MNDNKQSENENNNGNFIDEDNENRFNMNNRNILDGDEKNEICNHNVNHVDYSNILTSTVGNVNAKQKRKYIRRKEKQSGNYVFILD